MDKILNIRAFDLDKITEVDPDFLLRIDNDDDDHDHDHDEKDHKHEHHEKKEKKEKHGHGEGEHKEKKEKKEKKHDHHEHKEKEKKKPKHHHASIVTSCGFVIEGEFDMGMFNRWMGQLLREKGKDIYRMKGVLAVQGMPQRFVFQGT